MKNSIIFTVESWYILIPIFLIYILYLVGISIFGKKKLQGKNYFFLITFVIYVLFVIHFVYFPLDVNIGVHSNAAGKWLSGFNLIPILTIDIPTFILNVIMLIPYGIYLPLISKKNWSVKQIAKAGFLFSLSLEVIQWLFRVLLGVARQVDINDIIANTIGAVLGYLIIKNLLKITLFRKVLSK